MGRAMAILVRILLWFVWLASVGWLWHAGKFGTATAIALAALSLVVFAWPVSIARRRHDELRYVDMGKEPTGYH
jgi:O-antigen ligase